jgi:adenosylcobinamide-GDP ribazoletransferase
VGAFLGILLVLVDWASTRSFSHVSHFLSASLILAAYALFTGGLHHDGLVDTADAFWGWDTPDRRLEIMKDSRTGARGVAALGLFLLVELAAIYALPVCIPQAAGRFRWAALLSFPILGRWEMSYLCVRFPYARKEGTAGPVMRGTRKIHFLISTLLAVGGLAFAFAYLVRIPLMIPVLMVVSIALAEMMGSYFARLIGGITGDIIGAVGMLSECLLLLLLASRVPGLVAG